MKRNIKSIIALALVSIMVMGTMGGCKKDDSGGTSKDGKTNITFGIWDENQRPTMEQLVDAYEKSHEGVTVEVQLTPYKGGEYWTKLEASATGGTAPDVFWLNVLHAQSYQEGDILLDLSKYIEESDLDIHNNFPETLVKAYTFEDKIYAIPKDFDTNALWFNKEIFDNANIPYPTDDWTMDDLVETAKQLKDSGLPEGVAPFACPVDFQTWYYQTVYANGGWILNEDKTETGYMDPKTQEGIQVYIDMINEGLSPSLADLTDTTPDARFEGGNLAMIFAGSYMTPQYLANDAINTKADLVEIPEYKGVEPNIINGLGYAVYSGTKNEEAAVDFALWLGGSEAMEIQGKTGAVISARNDAQGLFADSNKDLNFAAYTNHSDVAYPLPVCSKAAELYDLEANKLKLAYSGERTLEDVCKELKEEADQLINK